MGRPDTWLWTMGGDFPPLVLLSLTPDNGAIAGGNSVVALVTVAKAGDLVEVYDDVTLVATVTPDSINTGTGEIAFTMIAQPLMGAITVKIRRGARSSNALGYAFHPLPTVVSISTASGPEVGGTAVTIAFTGLLAGMTAAVCGVALSGASVNVGAQTISGTTGSGMALGLGDVVGTNTDGQTTGTSGNGLFTSISAPYITTDTPDHAPTGGGATISLVGGRFRTGCTVTFDQGGTTTTVAATYADSGHVSCVAPTHAAGGPYVLRLTNPDGGYVDESAAFAFDAMTVTTISRSTGAVAGGGAAIDIGGTNYATITAVAFGTSGGGWTAATINTQTGTSGACSVNVALPAHARGLVDVRLTNAFGAVILPNALTFYATPSISGATLTPAIGSTAGSTSVALTGGSGLTDVTSGTLGGSGGGHALTSVSVVSDTAVNFATPSGSEGARDLVLANALTSGTKTGAFAFYATPSISGATLSALLGGTAGGTAVTVTGASGCAGATGCTVGGTACTSFVAISDSSFSFVTPAGTRGAAKDLVVANPLTTGTKTGAFTFYATPSISGATVTPSSGPTAGGTSITITGASACDDVTSVKCDGTLCTSLSGVTAAGFTCVTPTGSAGAKTLEAFNALTSGTKSSAFTYIAVPTITSITPGASITQYDDATTGVAVVGTGYTAAAQVQCDGVNQATTYNSSTSLTFTLSATAQLTSGSKSITVIDAGGTSSGTNLSVTAWAPHTEPSVTAQLWSYSDVGVTHTSTVTGWQTGGTWGTDFTVQGAAPIYNATDAAYNNKPTIQGTGTQGLKAAGTYSGPMQSPYWMVFVGEQGTPPGTGWTVVEFTKVAGTELRFKLGGDPPVGGDPGYWNPCGSAAGGFQNYDVVLAINAPALVLFTESASATALYKNNLTTAAGTGTITSSAGGDRASLFVNMDLYATHYSTAKCAALISGTGTWSTAGKKRLKNWANSKYGLTVTM